MIEGTRSPPDAHGVYEANVMIEGVEKGPRSSFFPKTGHKNRSNAIERRMRTVSQPRSA